MKKKCHGYHYESYTREIVTLQQVKCIFPFSNGYYLIQNISLILNETFKTTFKLIILHHVTEHTMFAHLFLIEQSYTGKAIWSNS